MVTRSNAGKPEDAIVDKTHEVGQWTLGELYRKYGEKWWRTQPGSNLGEKVASSFETFAAGAALDYDIVKQAPDACSVNVTGCRYAKFYNQLGAPELGFLLV